MNDLGETPQAVAEIRVDKDGAERDSKKKKWTWMELKETAQKKKKKRKVWHELLEGLCSVGGGRQKKK